MSRKPYTVENQRPRRTLNVYGTTLAPKGRGRTACVDLDLDQVLGASCIQNLAIGRLKVVRGDLAPVEAKLAELAEEPEETPALVEPAQPAKSETKKPETVKAPESTIPEHAERGEEGTEDDVGNESEPSSEETVEPSGTPASSEATGEGEAWTSETLSALSYREIQKVAKDHDVSASGSREELVERILDAQGET